jgi:hypothetical protein
MWVFAQQVKMNNILMVFFFLIWILKSAIGDIIMHIQEIVLVLELI